LNLSAEGASEAERKEPRTGRKEINRFLFSIQIQCESKGFIYCRLSILRDSLCSLRRRRSLAPLPQTANDPPPFYSSPSISPSPVNFFSLKTASFFPPLRFHSLIPLLFHKSLLYLFAS